MGSPYNLQSPASANSATWWSLMENSDGSDDEHRVGRRKHRGARNRSSHGNTNPSSTPPLAGGGGLSVHHPSSSRRSADYSSSRRSSAPLPQQQALSSSSSPDKMSRRLSRKSMGSQNTSKMSGETTPRRSRSEKSSRRSPPAHHHQHQLHQQQQEPQFSSSSRTPTSARGGGTTGGGGMASGLGPSLDEEEDLEQKKIRWETPTTHRYELAAENHPRLLEEKFLNVLDSMQSKMVCSQNFNEKQLMGVGGASNMMWNLLDAAANNQQQEEPVTNGTVDSNSQGQSSDGSVDDSDAFEDGPSVVHISANPPVFGSSITASESLLSSSQESDDDDDDDDDDETDRSDSNVAHRKHHHHHPKDDDDDDDTDTNLPAADSSQILDDLSGMESERKVVGYDNDPSKNNNCQQEPIVVNNDNRPPVKIYSTSMPFEATKEKKCIVSVGKLQDMHRARIEAKRYDSKKGTNDPPVPDISVGYSNEVSTMSASEDSYMYHTKMKQQQSSQNYNSKQERVGVIPENTTGLRVESNAKILFDSSFQEESRSCIPNLLQRKRRGADGATASSSSKSLGLRLLSRSGEANATSEKENNDQISSPYIYEYETGLNTYVAYFETCKGKETLASLQVIEHPNPPLLPFGSNEVVVKIEASTISQSDCAIRRGEWWGGTLSLPRIPGVAFAGRIDQVHKTGRNSMQVGDQVLSLVCSGSNSRYVCIPRERLVKVPSNQNQDSAKMACLPEIYLSAFQVVHFGQSNGARYRKNSLSGKSVMFVGGASAFGQAIVELSVEAGASVVYATASKVKQFQRIIEIGGIPLSDNPAEWLPSIHQQVDILIGCTGDTLKDTDPFTYDHLNVLKKKGQLILLGGPGVPNDYPVIHPGKAPCQVDVFKILKRAHKHNLFENWERDMKQGKRDLTHLIGLLHKGVLKPKILERIPLSKVSKAEDIVDARRLHGVIICEPWIQEKQR